MLVPSVALQNVIQVYDNCRYPLWWSVLMNAKVFRWNGFWTLLEAHGETTTPAACCNPLFPDIQVHVLCVYEHMVQCFSSSELFIITSLIHMHVCTVSVSVGKRYGLSCVTMCAYEREKKHSISHFIFIISWNNLKVVKLICENLKISGVRSASSVVYRGMYFPLFTWIYELVSIL